MCFFCFVFHYQICVYIILVSFFDEVSNFCNRILTNQKRELVVSNCQWNCIFTLLTKANCRPDFSAISASSFFSASFFFSSNKRAIDDVLEQHLAIPLDEKEWIELVYDACKKNSGGPEGDFTNFYKELDGLLEEYGKAAEERRKYQVAHLPLATSVSQLIKKVWINH